MRRSKTLLIGFVALTAAMVAAAQGVFDPRRDVTIDGAQWTWTNQLSPFRVETTAGTGFRTTLTFAAPTANRTVTVQNATTTLVGRDTTDTLTNKTLTAPTLTAPVITAPSGTTSTGLLITKVCTLTENGAGTSYTCTVPIPAGAIIDDITVIARVLWNGTSATLKVGDTADDDGWFTGVNVKATDLVVGEVLSIRESTLWGGKEGAYLVAASGRRGPTSSNFGLSYVAGSNITFIVTPGAADGSAGRTDCVVTYHVGEAIAQVSS